jgi:aldehyde dehydrogenase (NAD+)
VSLEVNSSQTLLLALRQKSQMCHLNSMEIDGTLIGIMRAYNGVAKWAKTESAPFSMSFAPLKPVIRKEPKGTVLIISPFNFPIWLSLPPVVRVSICFVFGAEQLMSKWAGGSHRSR